MTDDNDVAVFMYMLKELCKRKGFKAWWFAIDTATRKDILTSVAINGMKEYMKSVDDIAVREYLIGEE